MRLTWRTTGAACSIFVLIPSAVMAHALGESDAGQVWWKAWSFEPGIVFPLALILLLYLLGRERMRRHSLGRFRFFDYTTWRFLSGCLFLAIALLSPIHHFGEELFSVHMTQHEVLMLLAAPLLVWSPSLAVFLWALPMPARVAAGKMGKWPVLASAWHWLTRPAPSWCIHAAALWIWHLPVLFQATLKNDAVHALQHASFLGSALLFWWSLLHRQASQEQGSGILYVFTTAIHTSALGALLTFSSQLWYPVYANSALRFGLTPLEDQQLGGLIMWVPAGLVYIVVGLALLVRLLRNSEKRAQQSAWMGSR
jgi:putative membrane protein